MDVAGLDATEAFEDVGHSDEARETLEQLYVCDLKRQVCRGGALSPLRTRQMKAPPPLFRGLPWFAPVVLPLIPPANERLLCIFRLATPSPRPRRPIHPRRRPNPPRPAWALASTSSSS